MGSTRRFQIALIKKVATALDLEPEDLIDETPLERHRDQMGRQAYPDLSPLKSPDNYVEREWLDQEFDYFLSGLESDEGGLFVVEGHPGDGKTYWLQHLVHHRHLHLAHFFSSGSGITSQEQLIGSMTEQADSLDMCESSPHRGDRLAIF